MGKKLDKKINPVEMMMIQDKIESEKRHNEKVYTEERQERIIGLIDLQEKIKNTSDPIERKMYEKLFEVQYQLEETMKTWEKIFGC